MKQHQKILLGLGIALAGAWALSQGLSPNLLPTLDPLQPSFHTKESNKLFFRNTRQPYYDIEVLEAANMELCRLADRDTAQAYPVLQAKIVKQWLLDHTFLMLEPNAALQGQDTLLLEASDSAGRAQGPIALPLASRPERHFEAATRLYQALQRQAPLRVRLPDGRWETLFPTPQSREPFRKTMVDFYTLVGLLE
jgi:hypothetical protein